MNIENLKKSFQQMKWYEWAMAFVMIAIAAWSMISAFTGGSGGGSNPPWLTVINFISAVCGVFCIFFCASACISNFAFGLVNTLVYMIFLWYHKIYGTFGLELLIYLPFNIIGWIHWSKYRDNLEPEKTMVKKLTWQSDIIIIAIVVLAACVYHAILVKIGGTVPWLDAFTVSIGIIATGLEMLRYREQYWLWIAQDIVAVALYIVHFDAVYLTKKSIYLIMAIIGTYRWIKLQKERNIRNI
jgi:nicotinamide mononucleotide transporter